MIDSRTATSKTKRCDISILKSKLLAICLIAAKSRETIQSVMALLGSNITATALSAIGGLLVAYFLGPREVGAFRAFTIPLTYLMFLNLGTNDGLWRQIPYYVGKAMPERVNMLASSAGAFNIFLSFVISFGFICCAAYSLFHHDFYGVFGWLSQVLCCWGIFYGSYLTSTYRTLNHFVTMARVQVVQTILTFVMVLLLPFLRFYGLCARAAFPAMLGTWLYHRNRPLKVKYRFDIKSLRELLRIGLPFSLGGNLYFAAWYATESALVLYLGGVTALGLFSVATVIRSAFNSLPTVVMQVLSPRVVTAFAKDGSMRNAKGSIMWVTLGLMGFMAIIAYAASFLLDIFVPLLIPKYIAGIPVMKLSLWFAIVEAAYNIPSVTLFAASRPWILGRGIIVGAIVFALVTWLLLPQIGGLLAVTAGSLLGRTVRTLAAYVDLYLLMKKEREVL